jgi:hypothetical protein
MAKSKILTVEKLDIVVYKQNDKDYIFLTDIARYRDAERTNYIIQNWLRTRSAIEFCGLWEQLNNPDFKRIEFDAFKNESGANSFSLTPQKWIEVINAVLIYQGLAQSERLVQLNGIAITQMKSLINNKQIRQLK